MTWHRVRLDSVIGRIESGSRPKGGVSSDFGDVPSLGGENILNSGGITLQGVKLVTKAFYDRMTKGHLEDEDVLINKDGAQTGKVGLYHAKDGVPTCINEHLFLLRGIPDRITQGYIYYTLLSEIGQNQIRMQITGSAQPGLKSGFIKGIYTDIPKSVTEQNKITETLSTVDQAIEQTEALIAKQQRIKTGLMQDLLTRGIDEHGNLRSEETHEFKDSPLGRIPVEWKLKTLADLADVDRGKFTHRPRNDPLFYGGGYPFIQTGDITSRIGRKVISYTQTLNERGVKVSKEFPADTIAITIAANIADTAILSSAMYFPDSVVGAVVKSPNNTRFVELMVRKWKPILERLAPQSAQKNINLETLRPLTITTPTPEEQERIGDLYETVESEEEQMEQHLKKLRSLKTALMQDLLTGKVPVTPLLTEPQEASA